MITIQITTSSDVTELEIAIELLEKARLTILKSGIGDMGWAHYCHEINRLITELGKEANHESNQKQSGEFLSSVYSKNGLAL